MQLQWLGTDVEPGMGGEGLKVENEILHQVRQGSKVRQIYDARSPKGPTAADVSSHGESQQALHQAVVKVTQGANQIKAQLWSESCALCF